MFFWHICKCHDLLKMKHSYNFVSTSVLNYANTSKYLEVKSTGRHLPWQPEEHWWGRLLWQWHEHQRPWEPGHSPCPHHHSQLPQQLYQPTWHLWHAWCHQPATHGNHTSCQTCSVYKNSGFNSLVLCKYITIHCRERTWKKNPYW